MSPTSDREFLRLRALARTLLLTEGTAVAPGAGTPECVDNWIGDLVDRHAPTVASTSEALDARLRDRDLARAISDHRGSLMAAYGDAGYFVGLSVGLELAALTVTGALARRPVTVPDAIEARRESGPRRSCRRAR